MTKEEYHNIVKRRMCLDDLESMGCLELERQYNVAGIRRWELKKTTDEGMSGVNIRTEQNPASREDRKFIDQRKKDEGFPEGLI
jgi:hypothetical protein